MLVDICFDICYASSRVIADTSFVSVEVEFIISFEDTIHSAVWSLVDDAVLIF